MTKDEALKLALKALEVATTSLAKDRQEVLRAIIAIREALAQPEYTSEADTEELLKLNELPEPLRLAAMLEKTMQWPLHGKAADCLRKMHAALEQPAQPEQEPVALEDVYLTIIQWDVGGGKRSRRELARRIVAKYTTPPQPEPVIDKSAATRIATSLGWEPKRKPLTDEEIGQIILQQQITLVNYVCSDKQTEFARAIEAAHGIKENT